MILPGINSFVQGVETIAYIKTMGLRNSREGLTYWQRVAEHTVQGTLYCANRSCLTHQAPLIIQVEIADGRRNTWMPWGLALARGMGVNIASALIKSFLLIEIHTQERLLCIVENKMGNYLMMGSRAIYGYLLGNPT